MSVLFSLYREISVSYSATRRKPNTGSEPQRHAEILQKLKLLKVGDFNFSGE